jgi:hypothetical protein
MSAAPLGRTQATDDPTEMPRWGKVGKQRIIDEGPLPPFPNMSNVANMHDLPFLKAKYDLRRGVGQGIHGLRLGGLKVECQLLLDRFLHR